MMTKRVIKLGIGAVLVSFLARVAGSVGFVVVLGLRRANAEAIEHYVGARRAA